MNANINTLNLRRSYWSIGVTIGLFVLLFMLMSSSLLTAGHDWMDLAITLDLVVTVPLVYFLLIRKTNIPKTTVVPVIGIGLLLGTYGLPKDSQTYLLWFRTWALPVIEITVLSFVIVKVRQVVKTYKQHKGNSPDFFSALKDACRDILPGPLVLPFATEIAVMYYGFIHWRKRPLQANECSYHQNSGTPALLGAFLFVIAIETLALHLLLEGWNAVIAWVLSGLSIYTAIQVIGIAKSLSQRPIAIHTDHLHLKYGIMSEVTIPFSAIAAVRLTKQSPEPGDLTASLSPLGALEGHNVILTLKEAHTLIGLYGLKKKFTTLGLFVDEPRAFQEKIEKALI